MCHNRRGNGKVGMQFGRVKFKEKGQAIFQAGPPLPKSLQLRSLTTRNKYRRPETAKAKVVWRYQGCFQTDTAVLKRRSSAVQDSSH